MHLEGVNIIIQNLRLSVITLHYPAIKFGTEWAI